eukprot:6062261-Amphidinium_carterae.1
MLKAWVSLGSPDLTLTGYPALHARASAAGFGATRSMRRHRSCVKCHPLFAAVGSEHRVRSHAQRCVYLAREQVLKNIDAAASQLPRGHDAGDLIALALARLGGYITALQEHVFQRLSPACPRTHVLRGGTRSACFAALNTARAGPFEHLVSAALRLSEVAAAAYDAPKKFPASLVLKLGKRITQVGATLTFGDVCRSDSSCFVI